MTKTKQNKRYLILLAVVIMVALMSVACKKKVTDPVASFSTEEEVVTPEDPVTPVDPVTPDPEPTPDPVDPVDPVVPDSGAFSKYAGTYVGNNYYNDADGKGYYSHKAVLDGDNVKLYKVRKNDNFKDTGVEDLWETGNSVDGTFKVKGSWMTFSLSISGNKIVLNFPGSQQVTVWKK